MKKKYQRLNEEERDDVVALLNRRKSIREIGKELGRSPQVQYVEKSRNFEEKNIVQTERSRQTTGQWETDIIVGKGKSALKVAVERDARITKIRKVNDKDCKESNKALLDMLSALPESYRKRKSITYDNGCENVEHTEINEILKTKSYFCQSYHSALKTLMVLSGGFCLREPILIEYLQARDIATTEN